ncbi:MAG: Fe-S cluster assembly protein SufD [Woeseia sp.]
MTIIASDLLAAAVNRLPQDALAPVRKAALAQFSEHGFPTLRDEDWKYTNLQQAIDLSNAWLESGSPTTTEATLSSDAERAVSSIRDNVDANWILIANGTAEFVSFPGIDVAKLSDNARTASIIANDQMTSFNAALLQDGLRATIQASADSARPLGFLLVDEPGNLTQARLIIDVEAGVEIDIIEAHVSTGPDPQFANTVIQLIVDSGARVGYVRVQERAGTHLQVGRLIAALEKDAQLDYASFDFGGSLIRNDVFVDLRGPGATATLHGLYLAGDRQHIDNHTRIDHRTGPAVSREEYRGILSGRARCVFNGKVIVHEGADGTDAEQSNHNLLLSETAEIDTKPELEIYADDVKCAHGATVGQLDRAALFYLRSRGLDRDEASQLLTRAFAARILSASPVPQAHDLIGTITDRRLNALIDGEVP